MPGGSPVAKGGEGSVGMTCGTKRRWWYHVVVVGLIILYCVSHGEGAIADPGTIQCLHRFGRRPHIEVLGAEHLKSAWR